jgi:hypothetical protein
MAAAVHEAVAQDALVLPKTGPVAVVELLEDLEGPAAGQHVAAEQVLVDSRGELVVPGVPQQLEDVVEGEVRFPNKLVEADQMAAGSLELLERLAHLPGGLDLGVGGAVRARVALIESFHVVAAWPGRAPHKPRVTPL